MGNKIDIIGAGIAGLGTGCYLQMNGYNTEIFQLHHKLGGLCTSWKRNDSDQYRQEKEGIAQEIIGALDQRFGDFRAKVEMIDVSIPSTVVRNPSNWKESFEGWLLTPRMGLRRMKKVLPGLKQFYMAGRWVEPGGGLPGGLLSGRNVTQFICKKDGKRFTTTTL